MRLPADERRQLLPTTDSYDPAAMQVPVVTSEFKINYVRPAVGERLIARASADAVSKTQAVCRCEVFAVKGGVEKLCALAQGTIVRLSQD